MKDTRRQMALREFEQDTKDFMSTKGNRRIYAWLLTLAQVDRVSFAPGSSHADMAFRDGMKNLAHALKDRVMAACPEMHQTAMNEAKNQPKQEENIDE